MPFVKADFLQDGEQSLRFLLLALALASSMAFSLLKSNKREELYQTNPMKKALSIILITYMLIVTLTLANSINFGDGFFEVLKLFLFSLFFFYCTLAMLREEDNKKIFIISINVAVFVFTAFAVTQVYTKIENYFKKGEAFIINYSLSSSLGNKNFYAEAIFLCVPFIICGFLILKNNKWKVINTIGLLICLITIVSLQTLSTWLAVIAGVITYSIILSFNKKEFFLQSHSLINRKLAIVVLVISIFIITLAMVLFSYSDNFHQLTKRVTTVEKYITTSDSLTSYSELNNNSTYERLILWRNSVRMIKEHPLTGNGASNWKIYFPKYGVGAAPYMNSGSTKFIRPHNDYLFIAAESGIFGLLLYLSFFVTLFIYGIRIIKSNVDLTEKKIIAILLAGIAGYMVIVCFSIPNDRYFPVLLFMLMAAFIFSSFLKLNASKKKEGHLKAWQLLFGTGLIVSIIAISIGFIRLKSDVHLANAITAQRKKNWSRMSREIAATNKTFFPVDYTTTPLIWYSGFANFYSGNQQAAFSDFKAAEKINSYHLQVLNDLGTCYNLNGYIAKAMEYYQRVIAIAPRYQGALENISVIYYNSGNIDSAFAILTKYPLKKTPQYKRNLSAILAAKVNLLAASTSNKLLTDKINAKAGDEKFLISIFENAVKEKTTFEAKLIQTLDGVQ